MSIKQLCKNTYIYKWLSEYKWKKYSRRFGSIGRTTVVSTSSQAVTQNMYLDDYVIIQDHNNFISHKGKLIVKKYSVVSAGCLIIPGAHKLKVGLPFWMSAKHHIADKEDDIIIEEDSWIGAGCILLPGVKIGRGCVVGAGSVVTKDVPDYAVVVGAPARIVATKFSLKDVLNHERILYSASERRDSEYLENLYQTIYKNLCSIGDNDLSESDLELIKEYNDIYSLKMHV